LTLPTNTTPRFEINWVPLREPPEDMDFAFMISCDAPKHYCAIIGWKHYWSKTGMMYGCKYSEYKQYMCADPALSSSEASTQAIPKEETVGPLKDEDGFISASKFNRRRSKKKEKDTNSKLTLTRLVDSNGKKMTFTNFLLSFISKEERIVK